MKNLILLALLSVSFQQLAWGAPEPKIIYYDWGYTTLVPGGYENHYYADEPRHQRAEQINQSWIALRKSGSKGLLGIFDRPRETPANELRFSGTTYLANGTVSDKPAPAITKAPTETEVTRACVREMDKLLQSEGALATKKAEILQNIQDSFSEFDRRAALLLKLSTDSWTKESGDNVAKVICAIDDLKSVVDTHGSQAAREAANVSEDRKTAYSLSEDSLRSSLGYLAETSRAVKDDGIFAEKKEMYEFAKATGEVLLDLATSLTPGVSTGRDAYEAFTGKNLLTGEALTPLEQSLAVLCVASLGTGSIVKGALKGVEKIAELAKVGHRIEVAEHAIKNAVTGAERAIVQAERHGINIIVGPNATKVDRVIGETLAGSGNITSRVTLS
ncbi:MAG: pre-toxin TG domain-containing protein, partial [Bdellovibrionia bacterium]